jgi:hypothetical protein
VVLEEFGKAVGGLAASDQTEEDRERWFNQTYDQLRKSLHGDGHLKGIMFWRWDAINSQVKPQPSPFLPPAVGNT